MAYVRTVGFSGMGDAQTTAQGAQMAGGLATPAVTGALSAWATAAGPGATILGMAPAAAIPLVGAALVGVTALATYLIKNSGCGQTCIVTSQWANQAQDALKQNIDAYFALPAPRSKSAQTLALQNFDLIWGQLVKNCDQPQWGDAGKRCVSDRQRGACTWHATENSQWPGGVQQGACWNWFNGLRDPIANDTNVVEDSALSSVSNLLAGGSSSSSLLPVAIIAGLVILGVSL